MIIRHIKLARQDRIIHQQILEEDEDYLETPRQINNKATLNPEAPISETIISNKDQNFICQPSQPLYQNSQISSNERKLSIQQPLSMDEIIQPIQQASETKEMQNLSKYKRLRQLRMQKSINHSIRPNNKTIYNKKPLPQNQKEQNIFNKMEMDNHKQRSFKKYQLGLPQVSQIKQIQESIMQNRIEQQEENKLLKSKFVRPNFRSRLSETLNKFQHSKETKEENKKQRYAFSFSQQPKSTKLSKTTTSNSYQSDNNNSNQIVLQHFRSKAQSRNLAKINKKLLPQNIQAPDQQFSTIFGKSEPPKISDSQEQFSPKPYFQVKCHSEEHIVISYKTTLLELKQICCQKNIDYQQIVVMIPGPLSNMKFYPQQGQQEIFIMARKILNQMNINHTSINIKRYSNCVIIISGNIGIISQFGGRIYIGGWIANQKIGLGLEWYPGKYIYYGQFKNNKREGVGIFKGVKGGTAAGRWVDNTFYGPLIQQTRPKQSKKLFLSRDFEDQ